MKHKIFTLFIAMVASAVKLYATPCSELTYYAISADESKGSVVIVEELKAADSIVVTMRAEAKPGYMFTMWNMGWEEAEVTVTIKEKEFNGFTFIACFYDSIGFSDQSVIEVTPYTITVSARTNLPDMDAGPDDNPYGPGFEIEWRNDYMGGGFITTCAVKDGYMTATIDLHHPWAGDVVNYYPFEKVYWRPYYTSEAEWNEVLGTWWNEHITGESVEIPEWEKGYESPVDPTGIEVIESQKSKVESTKVIDDGVLYIMHGGQMYDAQGRLFQTTDK